ncbi:hypothetical protein G6L26_001510 [Agrobacterium radiobacter]|jgi:hypothetical protein|uniref:DUF2946 domain-containing protein n=2 Tax=Agrobacterium tumefaciens complex TaxID=1183400 RepID=A0AAW8LT24_AGRTU|nr:MULTISPECIES: hypothetical protein [Agrobacterium tumefaciens complex]MCP2135632.1 hypothetical protein [Rhizobium sp. SLBN-94]AYM04548.1 hypothetical protein At1D1460_03060 [Agrobacterium tumefaciens]EHH07949.1 hypothetical protein ATCR1_03394 [Agrobacterium tumefaciens CCNWGS0286]MBB4281465.1 hypothetical protein [Agrobacterium radiobacter]MBB4318087.1 hypothetical protein [Agrobacterium radiobacter]
MSQVVRTLMFLACLLYGAMPAQMAMSMPTGMAASSQSPMKHDDAHSHHADDRDHGSQKHAENAAHKAETGGCCPHGDNAAHPGSCAACLIVVPRTIFADSGRMTFAYPKPQRGIAFDGKAFAPPLPPPRA